MALIILLIVVALSLGGLIALLARGRKRVRSLQAISAQPQLFQTPDGEVGNVHPTKDRPPMDHYYACPYCGVILDDRPSGKRKCPDCKQTICVSKAGGAISLFTEDGFEEYKLGRKRESYRRKWLRALGQFGIDEAEFDRFQQSAEWRGQVNERDVFWGLMNKHVTMLSDLGDLSMLYRTMARFLYEEGSSYWHIAKTANRLFLKSCQEGAMSHVEISTCGNDSCSACRQLEGHILTIEAAIRDAPIPCQDCAFETNNGIGWCRCTYLPVIRP
ncbi:MAG: hypothetical protein ABIE70_02720 [bacterium]